MSQGNNLLPDRLTARQIRAYINFDGGSSVDLDGSSQSVLQSQGVAALWHLLGTKGYAYLGDEVGMGKTRQAMGIIATQFLCNPQSHIVIVCPGRTLQVQWQNEWDAFIRNCYKISDDRLVSTITGEPVQKLHLHERLRDFAKSLLLNEARIHLLRYSSFSRPIWFGDADLTEPEKIFAEYRRCLREIGIEQPSPVEVAIRDRFLTERDEAWREVMTRALNESYARRVGQLIKARDIDLVIFDEGQYLRQTKNRQNTNIRHVFDTHVPKWLFLSATPLHTGAADIRSLDSYLCRRPEREPGSHCLNCVIDVGCPRISHRMEPGVRESIDIVDILREFLVRRTRAYHDRDGNRYSKIQYRTYRRSRVSVAEDPFFALPMALVQKRLVEALGGKNNRFRQGECSSFESLSASLRHSRYVDHDGNPHDEPELEGGNLGTETGEETPDRSSIDALNTSFRAAMWGLAPSDAKDGPVPQGMPHAKLNETVERLFQRSLRQGSNRKTLVFVRRLDTVDEMLDLLLSKFQDEVDDRLKHWRCYLNGLGKNTLREVVWKESCFFETKLSEDEQSDDEPTEHADQPSSEGEEPLAQRLMAGELAYFRALKRSRGRGGVQGLLTSFQSRLLRQDGNPLDGFLQVLTEDNHRDGVEREQGKWAKAHDLWCRFVILILDLDILDGSTEGSGYAWMFHDPSVRDETYWKVATLKRCLLQSFRQTDFIVDLYILNRFLKHVPHVRVKTTLPEKLLWFFGENRQEAFPDSLETYVDNWKFKLRLWFDHFDFIADKCLRGGGEGGWRQILQRVDDVFIRMAPVLGRSGRLTSANAVTQFKLPTYPNILVCTDVLKEGVDMHLFCDEVVHYGVAWTSGDLEQRIGRIDRFGSMISRRIETFTQETGKSTPMPRLLVEFPYLDGTLDRYQVERVIREKVKSDYRLDLGKREDEIGIVCVDDLDSEEMPVHESASGVNKDAPIFYPDDVPTELEQEILKPIGQPLASSWKYDRNDADEFVHIPSIGAVRIRNHAGSDHDLLLRTYNKQGRRYNLLVYDEFLVPLGDELAKAGRSPAASLQRTAPIAVASVPFCNCFEFSEEWNTTVSEVLIESPFESDATRRQIVLLEQLEDFFLLRTPVFSAKQSIADQTNEDWVTWIAKQNNSRDWGYLTLDSDIVWFVVFAQKTAELSLCEFLARLANRVGKIGDRIQHLYAVSDHEDWTYRARMVFPSLAGISPVGRALLIETGEITMSVTDSDLEQCGLLIGNVQAWFIHAFEEVLSALYTDYEDDESLRISTVTISENGILHLMTEGAERFRLQAFLQLTGDSGRPVDTRPVPRVIWELAVSPNEMGPKPILSLASWEELPHGESAEGWGGGLQGQIAAYTRDWGKYRHFALYHRPDAWDAAQKRLLDAWKAVRDKMRGSNFMRKGCRELFFAINETATETSPEETSLA